MKAWPRCLAIPTPLPNAHDPSARGFVREASCTVCRRPFPLYVLELCLRADCYKRGWP